MNAKIPIKQLSEQVAAKVNIDAQDAQDAIKSIFALIADTLKDGKSVTLDDLGTFAPDVNPQEPVGFTTAPELADELNAPFAMFEPEIIADELSNAELSAVGSDKAPTPQENASAVTTTTPSQPQNPVKETPDAAPANAHVPRVGWAAARQATPNPASVEYSEKPVETPDSIPAPEPVDTALTEETPAPKPIEPSSEPTPELTPKVTPPTPTPVAAPEPQTQPSPVKSVEAPSATPPTSTPRPALEVPEWPEEEDTEDSYSPTETIHTESSDSQGRFKTGFFWGLIVGLLIGALLLFGYAMYFSDAF